MNEWLLITHITSLFPIAIFIITYKYRNEPEALYMLIKFIFCVTFSLIYHAYDVENFYLDKSVESIWTFLDGYASTALIFTTTLYGLRVRAPKFYLIASFFEPFILTIYILKSLSYLVVWTLLLSCFIIVTIQWRTLYKYITNFKLISFFQITSIILAAYSYFTAYPNGLNTTYVIYHSLWHCFVFISAGIGALLRYKLNNQLYPITRRHQVDSI